MADSSTSPIPSGIGIAFWRAGCIYKIQLHTFHFIAAAHPTGLFYLQNMVSENRRFSRAAILYQLSGRGNYFSRLSPAMALSRLDNAHYIAALSIFQQIYPESAS